LGDHGVDPDQKRTDLGVGVENCHGVTSRKVQKSDEQNALIQTGLVKDQ
jgi:hypothetical protein